MKGGAAGGGYSQVMPMEEINLHFTGDLHAITTANNLLSALIDNHIYHGNELGINPKKILWKRCLDLNDRALREVTVDLSRKNKKLKREDNFNISVASEVMAILCLAENVTDLKKRLGKIVVAYNFKNKPVFASDLRAVGAMAVLLKDALKPNLVQTLEHTPVLIHGGPFANIAHGCNSVLATRYGLKLADYLITEAGFGADLGAEKFFDIKCRIADLKPDAVVLTATVRALKHNGEGNLKKGIVNLEKHLENIKKFGVPTVVAINVFPDDTREEINYIVKRCQELGAEAEVSEVWAKGGQGGTDLAKKLLQVLKNKKSQFKPLYSTGSGIRTKLEKISKEIYGAAKVKFSKPAIYSMKLLEKNKLDRVPVCIAKTQYSLTDNPKILGRPEGFTITISDIRLSNGAGFIVALAGDIMTMPGLPKIPAAERIDVDGKGKIRGLF
jgi:formate--tetrahydrofolate ligase